MIRAGVCCLAVVFWAGVAYADPVPPGYPGGPIDFITLSDMSVAFGPGGIGSTLSVDGHPAQATITFQGAGTFGFSGDFDLDTDLTADWSSGGQANGWFENGAGLVLAYSGSPLVTADVVWYHLVEDDDTGVLVGIGLLTVTGGELVTLGDWGNGVGSTSSALFNIDTNIDDFSGPFTGSAVLTLFPDDRAIPEPATLLLLAVGGLAILRRQVR